MVGADIELGGLSQIELMSREWEGKRASFRGFKETGTSVVLRSQAPVRHLLTKKKPPRDAGSLNAEGKLGHNMAKK